MKKILIILITLPVVLTAQTNLLFEDFNNGLSWTVYDQDGLSPNSAVSFVNAAWVTLEDSDSTGIGDSCAVSTSWYNPAGQSDDWLVLPAVTLGAGGNYLYWQAKSEDGAFPEDYDIMISTTGNTPADFDSVFYSVYIEDPYWKFHKISIDSFAGQTIYIAFVNVSNDNYLLFLDNVGVVESDPMSVPDPKNKVISVYPNPANSAIRVNIPNVGSSTPALITDALGRQLPVTFIDGQLDVSGLSSGLYALQIEHNEILYRSKFIVSH